jgi:hypothetical protein
MEDHNATEPEHEPVDARALVAALTTLLVDEPYPALGTENRTNLIDRGTLATACLPNLIDRRMSTSNSVNHFSSLITKTNKWIIMMMREGLYR